MSIDDLSTLSREQLVSLSRMAEQSERYEEMIQFVKAFIGHGGELSVEERNILSVAFKNVVGALRSAWRVLSSIIKKEERRNNADQ